MASSAVQPKRAAIGSAIGESSGFMYLTWGGTGTENGEGIWVDESDNIYASGATNSFGAGNYDVFLVKYDGSTSTQLWNTTWGGAQSEDCHGTWGDGLGGIYVFGNTYSFGAVNGDLLLLKYDGSDGTLIWNNTWNGPGTENAHDIWGDGAGAVFTSGRTTSYSAGGEDAILIKWNATTGTIIWNNTWGGTGNDMVNGVWGDGDGNVYTAGYTYSYGTVAGDLLLIKWDATSGARLWNRTWGGTSYDYGSDVWGDGNGNVYTAGYTESFDLGGGDVMLVRWDEDGNRLWSRTFGGWGTEYCSWIWGNSTNLYTAGSTSTYGAGGDDYLLIKWDLEGNELWYRTWGGASTDRAYKGWTDGSTFLVAGRTASFGAGGFDLGIARTTDGPLPYAPKVADFSHVKAIKIAPGTPTSDYVIRLDLNATFDYAACQADGDDVRFFDDLDRPLHFWTETWTSSSDSILWVRIPAVGTKGIKMAYGNATVGSGSDGDATFPLFDDFSGTAIDTSKWTVEGDAYSTASIVDEAVHIRSLAPNNNVPIAWMGFNDLTINHGAAYGATWHNAVSRSNEFLTTLEADSGFQTTSKKNQTWILMDYAWIDGSQAVFKENESIVASHASNVPNGTLPAVFATRSVVYGSNATYGALIRSKTAFAPGHAIRGKTYIQYDYRAAVICMEPVIDLDWVFTRKIATVEPEAWLADTVMTIGPQIQDFGHVRTVSIDPATPVSDYQIRIDINSSFQYPSCQADGDDIRFFDGLDHPLYFWTEKWTNGGDSIIWVKIPAAGTTSIKMAFGNATVGSGSNGDATFPLFDDFSGPAIDTSKWAVEGDAYSSATIVSGTAHIRSFAPNNNAPILWMGFSDLQVKHAVTYHCNGQNAVYRTNEILATQESGPSTLSTSKKNQTWILMDYAWIDGTQAVFKENESVVAIHASNVPGGPLPALFATRSVTYGSGLGYGALIRSTELFIPGYAIRGKYYLQYDFRTVVLCLEPIIDLDWVFVRKVAQVEPVTHIEGTAPPAIVVNSPLDGAVLGSSLVPLDVLVTGTDLDSTWYQLDGGVNVLLPSSTSITVADGTHSITFYANNTFGDISSTTTTFMVDTTAPVVNITNPLNDASLASSNVNFVFTATDLTKDTTWYTVNGGTPVTVVGSSFVLSALDDGLYTVAVSCNDSFGRVSTSNVSFVVDATNPSIAVDGFPGLSLQQGDVAYLNWTLGDAHPSTFTLQLNGQVIRSGTYSNATVVAVQIDTSEVRALNYTMVVMDTFGNVERHERSIDVLARTDGGIFLSVGVNIIDRRGTLGVNLTLNMNHWAVLYLDVDISVTTTAQLHVDALPSGYVIALPVAFDLNITNSSALINGRIRVYYAQADIANQIDESTMAAMRWDDTASSWVMCTEGFSRSQNYIEIGLSETGLHVFVATPKRNYVPIIIIVLIGITGGIVAIASYNYSRKKTTKLSLKSKAKTSYANVGSSAVEAKFGSVTDAKRARLLKLTEMASSSQKESPPSISAAGMKLVKTSEPDVDIAARAASASGMATEVRVEQIKAHCVVHKGPISGLSYTCKHCGTVYCMKCARHLIEMDETCWSCQSAIDLEDGESVIPKDQVTVGTFSNEIWQRLRELDLPEEIFDEVIEYLKNLPPNARLKYLDETFKNPERFDEDF